MSVQWAGNMRGPRSQTTASRLELLLPLLLLLSGLTRTVLCEEDDAESNTEAETTEEEIQATEEPGENAEPDPGPAVSTLGPNGDGLDTTTSPADVTDTELGGSGEESGSGFPPVALPDSTPEVTEPEAEDVDPLLIAIPAALVVLLVAIVVGVVICRRRSSKNRHTEMKKEDPYLDSPDTEKVPMPMFEEDVPSVLELEMDELDGWMKKDGELEDFNQQV